MPWLTLEEIDDDVFQALKAPRVRFYLILSILLLFIIAGAIAFVYQVKTGMGVTGLNHPVMWGTYLGNFIFFIGIAHSGTFISAILYLLRARFRDEISRSSEAMTVIMISIALSYPLIHLGRIWMLYYVLPYPSQREIWPNFISPFLWDLFAITTYLIVSTIFFYVGLIPDLAAARDQFTTTHGPKHPRTRLYRALSLGWMGSTSQWQHDTRAYLYFAVLATPLVISVHTVVSFDFSMANLPGWHITLYAPYFVTGAIHSGLAMVLTLMIPMRSILPIGHIIQPRHFNKVAQVMLVTGSLLAYFYLMENFSGWYSQEVYENQFVFWRATGPYAWMFWTLIPLIILAPMTFISNRLRNNLSWLFIVSILVNIGMWTERYLIVAAATSHGFLPHAWGFYIISLVELLITIGSMSVFLFFYLLFAKIFPVIPMADLKAQIAEEKLEDHHVHPSLHKTEAPRNGMPILVGVYNNAYEQFSAVKHLTDAKRTIIETFTPMKIRSLERILGRPDSPVKYWGFTGALLGIVCGYAFPIYTGTVNNLIVGAKHPAAWIPYTILAFELMVLFAALANLTGFIVHARLYKGRVAPYYDNRFSRHMFGVALGCPDGDTNSARKLLEQTRPQEIITHEQG